MPRRLIGFHSTEPLPPRRRRASIAAAVTSVAVLGALVVSGLVGVGPLRALADPQQRTPRTTVETATPPPAPPRNAPRPPVRLPSRARRPARNRTSIRPARSVRRRGSNGRRRRPAPPGRALTGPARHSSVTGRGPRPAEPRHVARDDADQAASRVGPDPATVSDRPRRTSPRRTRLRPTRRPPTRPPRRRFPRILRPAALLPPVPLPRLLDGRTRHRPRPPRRRRRVRSPRRAGPRCRAMTSPDAIRSRPVGCWQRNEGGERLPATSQCTSRIAA